MRKLDYKEIELVTREAQAVEHTYWVYFITTMENNGPIKIGHAINVEKRLKDIQACSPVLLRIMGVVPGTSSDERDLHELFAEYRLHGEWFDAKIRPKIMAILKESE